MCLSHVGTAAVAAQHCHRPVPQLPYCCLSPAAVCPGVPCVQEGLSCQQRLRKACIAPALPSRSQSVCWLGCGVPGQPGLGALWGSCLLCFFISSLWKHFCSSCEEQGFLDETDKLILQNSSSTQNWHIFRFLFPKAFIASACISYSIQWNFLMKQRPLATSVQYFPSHFYAGEHMNV